jgi:PhnB protein
MKGINPYLSFPGNTEEAFNFYKSVFGGEFNGGIMRYKDAPGGEKLSKDEGNKVMHVELPVQNGYSLMGSDITESRGYTVIQGNNVQISIHTDTREETERFFKGLSAGGKIDMPLEDTFWGAYFGMFTDKFGIKWMINQQKN